jgi:8-oxo-dGTP diphosphatase
MAFLGCKAALFHDDALLCYLRDDKPGLPWPAMWDLPGGGREGSESAEDCLLRELREEFGLSLSPDRLVWRQRFAAMLDASTSAWFFAGHLSAAEIAAITFGDEGQEWRMMRVGDFLAHPHAIPELQRRVALALAGL